MRAWQFTAQGTPLQLNEVPAPAPDASEIVIDVKAAGICHTDTGYMDGTLTYALGFSPITLGHEIAGVVAAVGAGVTTSKVGDRVVVPAKSQGPGTKMHGGFAAKVVAPYDFVVPLPEGIPWDQAAAATDAGLTSYHSVVGQGGVTLGTRVGIIGFGGLGSMGAQISLALGAEVFVAEKNQQARDFARQYGVSSVADTVLEFAGKQLDVIIDFAGFGTTTADAITTVRRGGRVVQVGLGVAQATIPIVSLTAKEVSLVGSLAGSNEDCYEVLKLIAAGKVASRVTHVRFEGIPEALDRLRNGQVVGRLVSMYSKTM